MQLASLDPLLKVVLLFLKGFQLTPQVLDRLVLALNQLVYGMVIEVLFSFLRGDLCNL